MIKFSGQHPDGRPFIGIGLSEENILLLRQGSPVLFKLEDLLPNCPADVMIMYGRTEERMAAEIQKAGLIGPATKVTYGENPR